MAIAARLSRLMALLALSFFVAGSQAQEVIEADSATTGLRIVSVAEGLTHPWGLAFLPDGRMLVTEREGSLRIVTPKGEVGPALKGLPEIVSRGQGGLLDVTLDPNFEDNRWVYFAFSEPGEDGTSGTSVARGKLDEGKLTETEIIFRQEPKVKSNGHFGSRLVFKNDGTLFITMGDRQQDHEQRLPQKLDSHIGTVARINPDGSVPADNPFVDDKNALPEIWSYGHRNVQGADLHPTTGELWTGEHGPQGGDEINITLAGNNYGWPVITYGEQYGGGEVLEGITHKDGMEQPIYFWRPSIANAGMTFYTGDKFPEWNNNLLVTSLRGMTLARLVVENNRVIHEEQLLKESLGKRLRDVVQGPDGFIYLLTDESNGKILRLEPAQ